VVPEAHPGAPPTAEFPAHQVAVGRDVTIAHVSDLHLGTHSPAAVAELVADVTAAAPTITVITGDLTARARPGQYRQAAAIVEALPRPRLLLIGNHDVPLDNPLLRLLDPYRRYRRYLGVDLDTALDVPGLRVLGLGSMPRWRWKSGRVGRAQCAMVVDVLGSAAPGAVRVLALHHPIEPARRLGLLGRGRLLAALAVARTDLVLAGHTHRSSARRIRLPGPGGPHPVIQVVAGTATSTRTRGEGRSWALIRFRGGTVTVQHRPLDGAGHLGSPDPRSR
jgi:3',5'-cyclic AMP phosphodiesterase CpdA